MHNTVTTPPGYRVLRKGEITVASDTFFWSCTGRTEPIVQANVGREVTADHEHDKIFLRKVERPLDETPLTEAPTAPLPSPKELTDEYERVTEGNIKRGDILPFESGIGWAYGLIGTRIDCYHRKFVYRRKPAPTYCKPTIEPGEGFRLLKPEEKIQVGDEYHLNLDIAQPWQNLGSNFIGRSAGEWLRHSGTYVWRRKVVVEAPKPTVFTHPEDRVCPGFGYRLLNENDHIRAGDDYWSTAEKRWFRGMGAQFVDRKVTDPVVQGFWRRRRVAWPVVERATVHPGAGYRLLAKGEKLLAGDEYCARYGANPKWKRTEDVGAVYGVRNPGLTYRRKLPTPAARIGESKPFPAIDKATATFGRPYTSHVEALVGGGSVRVARDTDGSTSVEFTLPKTGFKRGIRWSSTVTAAIEKGLRLTR